MTRRSSLRRSRPLLFVVIAIPLVVCAFLAVLLLQERQLERSQQDLATLRAEAAALREQRDMYRGAYEALMDDALQLSSIYGGQQRYKALAQQLHEQELNLTYAKRNATLLGSFTLPNPRLWQEYRNRSIVRDDCLQRLTVKTPTDRVAALITASGSGELFVYADGNYLTNISVAGSASSLLFIALPAGSHELSVARKRQGVGVDAIYIEAQAANATFDAGEGWAMFDCEGAMPAMQSAGQPAGAARVAFQRE